MQDLYVDAIVRRRQDRLQMEVLYEPRQVRQGKKLKHPQRCFIEPVVGNSAAERCARPSQAGRRVDQLDAAVREGSISFTRRRDGGKEIPQRIGTLELIANKKERALPAIVDVRDVQRPGDTHPEAVVVVTDLVRTQPSQRIGSGVPNGIVVAVVKAE